MMLGSGEAAQVSIELIIAMRRQPRSLRNAVGSPRTAGSSSSGRSRERERDHRHHRGIRTSRWQPRGRHQAAGPRASGVSCWRRIGGPTGYDEDGDSGGIRDQPACLAHRRESDLRTSGRKQVEPVSADHDQE